MVFMSLNQISKSSIPYYDVFKFVAYSLTCACWILVLEKFQERSVK